MTDAGHMEGGKPITPQMPPIFEEVQEAPVQMSRNMSRWESVRTKSGWHLRLKGGNGEIVMVSETYTDPRAVYNALGLIVGRVMEDMRTAAFTPDPGQAVTEVDER